MSGKRECLRRSEKMTKMLGEMVWHQQTGKKQPCEEKLHGERSEGEGGLGSEMEEKACHTHVKCFRLVIPEKSRKGEIRKAQLLF